MVVVIQAMLSQIGMRSLILNAFETKREVNAVIFSDTIGVKENKAKPHQQLSGFLTDLKSRVSSLRSFSVVFVSVFKRFAFVCI